MLTGEGKYENKRGSESRERSKDQKLFNLVPVVMAASQEAMRAPRTVLAESAPLPFEDLAREIRLKAVQRREKRQGLSAAVSSSFLPSFL